MADKPRFYVDRFLPRDAMRPQRTMRGPEGRDRAISPIGKAWMNGSTLRVRFLSGTPAQQAIAREQAGWWAAVANLKFDFKMRTTRRFALHSIRTTAHGPTSARIAREFRPASRRWTSGFSTAGRRHTSSATRSASRTSTRIRRAESSGTSLS